MYPKLPIYLLLPWPVRHWRAYTEGKSLYEVFTQSQPDACVDNAKVGAVVRKQCVNDHKGSQRHDCPSACVDDVSKQPPSQTTAGD